MPPSKPWCRLKTGALLIGTDTLFVAHGERLVALAQRHAVLAMFQFPDYVRAGGLMSYSANVNDGYRQLGIYTGRILKGEQARGPAGAAVHPHRVRHQHEGRQGARPQRSPLRCSGVLTKWPSSSQRRPAGRTYRNRARMRGPTISKMRRQTPPKRGSASSIDQSISY